MRVKLKRPVEVVSCEARSGMQGGRWRSAGRDCTLAGLLCSRAFPCSQPPPIQAFVDSVIAVPLERIAEPLRGFAWCYDKARVVLQACDGTQPQPAG
jgi:hypothetical protein